MNQKGYYILILFMFVVLIFIFYIYKIDRIIFHFKRECGRKKVYYTHFPTFVYDLLLSGYKTYDQQLGFDKRYAKNLNQFTNDVKYNKINMVIINNIPYSIQYKDDDEYYTYFHIENKCRLLNLGNCKSNDVVHVQDMMIQFLHILGFYVE